MAVIDGATLKGRCGVIPESLKKTLEQLHVNHMGIKKL